MSVERVLTNITVQTIKGKGTKQKPYRKVPYTGNVYTITFPNDKKIHVVIVVRRKKNMKCGSKWYAYEINSGYPVIENTVSLKDLLRELKICSNMTQHETAINHEKRKWINERFATVSYWTTIKYSMPLPFHEAMKVLP